MGPHTVGQNAWLIGIFGLGNDLYRPAAHGKINGFATVGDLESIGSRAAGSQGELVSRLEHQRSVDEPASSCINQELSRCRAHHHNPSPLQSGVYFKII